MRRLPRDNYGVASSFFLSSRTTNVTIRQGTTRGTGNPRGWSRMTTSLDPEAEQPEASSSSKLGRVGRQVIDDGFEDGFRR